jgi:hypothetical protein
VRCTLARDFTVGKALTWRSSIDADVPYQRESFVWSTEQQQLFIDSLLNGYDVPKIYLHDLRGEHPTKVYAIVDGKQRLTTIWRFLRDELPLAPDFRVAEANLPDLPHGVRHPVAGDVFSQLDRAWQRVLKGTYLSVVLIRKASPDDIEELFSRLNNGEPLNAAERRNAFGGDMASLVREIAGEPFFTDWLPWSNERLQHIDLSAKVLRIIESRLAGDASVPDLRAPALDAFVRRGRRLQVDQRARLVALAGSTLSMLTRAFEKRDQLLRSHEAVPLFVLWMTEGIAIPPTSMRATLEQFELSRRRDLDRPASDRTPELVEFTLLSQHEALSAPNLGRRLEILRHATRSNSART